MSDDPYTQQAAVSLPTAKEIYDAIMGEIEPDLTTAMLPTLEEKYRGETPEEKHQRYLRYQEAYEDYEAAYEEYINEIREATHACRRAARESDEQAEQAVDVPEDNPLFADDFNDT